MYSSSSSFMKRFVYTALFLFTSIFIILNLRTLEIDFTVDKWPLPLVESTAGVEDLEDLPFNRPSKLLGTSPPSDASISLDIPDDYALAHEQSEICEQRLGLLYLKEFRHNRAAYCSEGSNSQLTCFHAQTDKKDRIDSFCIGQGAQYDRESKKFQLSCVLMNPVGLETQEPSVPLQDFQHYWYNTGPHHVMDKAVEFGITDLGLPQRSPETFTILLKREGASNPWHCLLEIMSLSMSLDVLQMSPNNGQGGAPFFAAANVDNTQVVILDDVEDGPYFDLWQLFANKPTVRIDELPQNADVGNIIIPLPGGSNPLWQGDWEPSSCENSELLRTFSWRVRQYYDITETKGEENEHKVIVTVIARRGSRKLVEMDKRIAGLNKRYDHAKIQVIDLEDLSFAAQIQLVHNSDVLVGVHGAGLTHGLWMKAGSTMVEILPEGFNHKGFRNFAGALGHKYFSTHGKRPYDDDEDWQSGDVALEEGRFLEIMDVAIASELNKGHINFDVN